MGLQVPCGMDSEVSEEGSLRTASEGVGDRDQGAGQAKGERGHGGEVDGRSCTHVDLDSPKIFGSAGDRVYQRQERDLCGEIVREAEELRGAEFLGPGILCIDGGIGRGSYSGVYTESGRSR